jgi:acyl-CoA thioesterase FadM
VDYLKPVLIGVPYVVRARIDRRDGRKLWVSCECTGPEGVVTFRAVGLFVVVGLSHFSQATSGGGQDPVAP